jgi:hypothetical protein
MAQEAERAPVSQRLHAGEKVTATGRQLSADRLSMSRAKLWVLVFGSLALLVLMFAPISFAVDRRFWERLLDAGHFPLFFSYASLLWWTNPWKSRSPGRRLITSVSVTIALAGLVELVQPSFGRTKSGEDFRNGALGALIAGAVLFLAQENRGRLWWAVLAGVTSVICCLLLEPAWLEGRGILWRRAHFPMLGDFEEVSEKCLWEAQGGSEHSPTSIAFSSEHASRGRQSLGVMTGQGSWAGVTYFAGDQDWREGRGLSLEVFNPGPAFLLSLRVDDDGDCSKYGQRYDDGFAVTNGWNHLRAPMTAIENGPRGRQLNLKKIRRLAIFTGEAQPSRQFFLDYVRLE